MDLRPPLLCLPPVGHSARRWAQALGSEAKQPPCPTSNAFPAKLSFATCHWTRSHTGIPQSVQQPEKTTGYKTALRPGPQPLPQPGGAGACPGGQPSYADLRPRQEQGLRCNCPPSDKESRMPPYGTHDKQSDCRPDGHQQECPRQPCSQAPGDQGQLHAMRTGRCHPAGSTLTPPTSPAGCVEVA